VFSGTQMNFKNAIADPKSHEVAEAKLMKHTAGI
jgi:hypothetical protein